MKHIYKRYELWGLLLIFIATIFCEYYETLSLIEDQTLSYRQLIRTSFRKVKKVHEKNVVLVSLDDDYYEKTSVKPFRRSDLADIIENINKLGAKLIVVNILMTYPDYSFEEDRALYQLLKKPNFDNVILSSHIECGCNCTDGNIIFPSQTVWPQKISTGYINIVSPSAVVTFLSRLRLYPSLVQKYSAWPLAIQAASQFLDISPRIDNHVLYLGDQALQLDQRNDLYIDYSPVPMDEQFINEYMGLTATPFLKVQFPDNFKNADQYFSSTSDNSSEVDMQFIELLYWVKDKIVVIGDTSRDSRNWFDTPVGTMFGSEIVADTISTLLSDSPLCPASLIVEVLVSVLMLSLILMSVVKCHNARYSFLAYLCINILFTVLCAFVYSKYGYILTMTYNYLYGLVLYLATTVYYRTIDIRKKEQAYQKLEKAEEQYRAIFENAIEGLFLVDEKGKTIATNPATQQILGYDSQAELENILLDQDDNRLYVNKADHKKLVHLLKEKTVVKDFETRVFRKDKSWIWISFNVRKFKDRHSNKTIYEGFFVDITESKKRIQAEREAEAAKAAMKSRNEILGAVSHEIKTPLNAILGMASFLKNSELSEDQKRSVIIFENSGQYLLTLIKDVLKLTKLESGQIEINPEPFDLTLLIDTIKEIMNRQKETYEKNVTLKYNLGKAIHGQVIGDKNRLQQIIINLMDNALKFTDKGSIALSISTKMLPEFETIDLPVIQSDKLQLFFFQVKDTGSGIPKESQKTIFDTFCQIKSQSKNLGAGLGLPICKRLVELMNGIIILHSEVDKGSTFSFVVPFELNHEPDLPEKEKSKAPPLNILLVDDNKNNQAVFEIYFLDTDHVIDMADDGDDGVEMFKRKKYDIVFMDLQMPRMNGLEATQFIRKWEKENNLEETPVIAVSAQTFLKKDNKAIKAGCNGFIEKPIDKNILMTYIAQLESNAGST